MKRPPERLSKGPRKVVAALAAVEGGEVGLEGQLTCQDSRAE